MTIALKDQNHVSSKLAVLNTDTVQGTHLVNLSYVEATKGINVNHTATISFTMTPVSPQDENYVDCWLFEGTDGLLYPAVATASGELLVNN